MCLLIQKQRKDIPSKLQSTIDGDEHYICKLSGYERIDRQTDRPVSHTSHIGGARLNKYMENTNNELKLLCH